MPGCTAVEAPRGAVACVWLGRRLGHVASVRAFGKRHHDGPATRHLAAYWLKHAYELSEVPQLTEACGMLSGDCGRGRKAFPVKDIGAAGGWKDISTLIDCYQQPDDDTLRAVVEFVTPALPSSAAERRA